MHQSITNIGESQCRGRKKGAVITLTQLNGNYKLNTGARTTEGKIIVTCRLERDTLIGTPRRDRTAREPWQMADEPRNKPQDAMFAKMIQMRFPLTFENYVQLPQDR
jgi:hypothetical protein